MDTPTHESHSDTQTVKKSGMPMGMIAAAAVLVVGVGAVGYKMMGSSSAPAATPSTMTESQTETKTMDTAAYKDGEYSAAGTYTSPAGAEEIGVKITLKDNIVTDADVEVKATNPKSKYMQDAFAKGYKEMVIGKNINEIKLEKVSGSSLTPMGFNTALEAIKTQAVSS